MILGTKACLHSSRSQDHGHDIDHGGEAGIGLLIARGDASKRFQRTEEVLDEVAPLVFFGIMRGVSRGPLAQGNHSLDAAVSQLLAQPVRIERLVADQGETGNARHEHVHAGDIVSLAGQKNETDQIAEPIDERCNLGGQAAARFADGLILSPPFAPVPC
jgi:hypothetical protein